jgi:outer membrane receptor protein involved in Fe transport
VRFSIGGGVTDEEYTADRTLTGLGGVGDENGNLGVSGSELGRTTTYAFGELFVPIIGAEQGIPLFHRLEVSLAARYTDYEDESDPAAGYDFGSDTMPKFGLLWSPVDGLNLRGTYGQSYRAPTLSELDPAQQFTSLIPSAFTLPGINEVVLAGVDPNIRVERSESWTAGFDFRPDGSDGPYISATYFNIDYKDRVAISPLADMEFNPGAFPELAFHATSAAHLEQVLRANLPIPALWNLFFIPTDDLAVTAETLFALDPELWIFDTKLRNFAETQIDGFDLSVGDRFSTGVGNFHVGAQVTRILEFKERASPTAPITPGTDTATNPADFRGRFFVAYDRGRFSSAVNVNYVDDYKNPTLLGGTVEVDDWTTVDWTTSYEFGGETGGLLPGFELTLGVQNLFDEDPPFVAQDLFGGQQLSNYGFDAANHNPVGRVVMLGISKTW